MDLKLLIRLIKKSILPIILGLLVIIFYSWYGFKLKALLSEKLVATIGKTMFVLGVLVIVYWLQRLVNAFFEWYKESLASVTASKIDDHFLPLFSRASSVILWLIAVIILLAHFGININALLATLGVGSLAIALAAQDTIANLIAGFLIMVDRPFRVGDKIQLPSGEKVKVLDIGIRRSKFLAEDQAVIIAPNLDLSKNRIKNYSYQPEI